MSKQPNLPTHRAYATFKKGEKIFYREIGALWPHKTESGMRGDGFWLKLDLVPTSRDLIAIQRITTKSRKEQPEQGTSC